MSTHGPSALALLCGDAPLPAERVPGTGFLSHRAENTPQRLAVAAEKAELLANLAASTRKKLQHRDTLRCPGRRAVATAFWITGDDGGLLLVPTKVARLWRPDGGWQRAAPFWLSPLAGEPDLRCRCHYGAPTFFGR